MGRCRTGTIYLDDGTFHLTCRLPYRRKAASGRSSKVYKYALWVSKFTTCTADLSIVHCFAVFRGPRQRMWCQNLPVNLPERRKFQHRACKDEEEKKSNVGSSARNKRLAENLVMVGHSALARRVSRYQLPTKRTSSSSTAQNPTGRFRMVAAATHDTRLLCNLFRVAKHKETRCVSVE